MHLPHLPAQDWESPDASALREFLDTPTGKKIFPVLLAGRPALKAGSVDESALEAKLVQGYESALTTLSALAALTVNEQPMNDPNPYPPLDQDDGWDGEKLNPEPKQ